mgnify:CR=1 FL=1
MKKALHLRIWLFAAALFPVTTISSVHAQTPPAGFASVTVSGQWTEAVGLTFNQDGSKMFVWERGGKVWVVVNNQKQLMLDISEEVGAWWDHGLLGFALHPQFEQNGYFYVHYLVDRHHLINYGTAAYNPAANDYFSATIGRLTRYTATPSGNGYIVNPASRKVLIGETKTTGIPVTERSHSTGSILFGTDNTLMVAIGDGAGATTDLGSHSATYYEQALADGILTPAMNIGVFRSQMLDCLNGKILRIDPETGLGIPSNPFYDPLRPDATVSKVWALGLRQPFRVVLKPGTGSHNPEDGNPGTFYIGEVGYNTWEELNVMDKPGMNFGWPIFEGLTPSIFASMNMANTAAPNPLYLNNGCTQQYFNYQDLLKQATLSGTAVFNNPCNGTQGIPSSIPTFVHTRPLIDWHHGTGPSRTGIFSGQTASEINIGASGSPVSGPQFGGSASVAGVFYTGTDFPESYRNTYFFGDYASAWIRNLTVDAVDRPVAVRNFVDNNAAVVCMATNPSGEGLYYINFGSEIRRIYYSANRPPVAVISSDKTYGPAPMQVQFRGDASTDPEGQPLSYSWDFGDGSSLSTAVNPSHTFNAATGVPTKFTVKLTVRDNQNVADETTLIVSVNNTPPRVTITSPADNTLYPMTAETVYNLSANVQDDEHSAAQLSYAWLTILHHNEHEHPDPIDTSPSTTVHVAPLGCDGQTYYVRVILTVTDAAGASTTKEVRLYPDCTGVMLNPEITWPAPAAITEGTPLGAAQLNATAGYNGTTVVGTFAYTPAAGTVLGAGNGQQLSVTFTPSNTSLYNVVSKTVTINVQPAATTLYRAINVNGPSLLIDGRSWEAGTSAPNVSFTNAIAFSNQGVTLVPSTDANRATMIRSSLWGRAWSATITSVPAGTYQVWIYVWEDNSAEIFSVSLEGATVQSNYNSGTAGSWSRLGPFQAIINDGAINLGFSGGASNLSGIEVWRVGTPVGNRPPVVNSPIADQNANVGVPYSFTFPTSTFSDPDAGTTLSYAASLSPTGSLPGWLSFNPATRTFSGTPTSNDVSTLQIQLTATDGAGGSVSDVFALTINPAGSTTLYRAINLNGPALQIDGNNWEAGASAPNISSTNAFAFVNQSVPLVPSTDANRATMIRSSFWGWSWSVTMSSVPAGTYQLWMYVWEDNSPETYSVTLEGVTVQPNYNSGTAGRWSKLGPFQATINDGTINLGFSGGASNLSGIEVWHVGTPAGNQPPVIANPIADRSTTAGSLFTFTFPSNTFTDPDPGTVLSYTATLSPTGSLPAWLTFNPATRTFSGTPSMGDVTTLQLRVTASDGAGGSASDVFALVVNEPASNQPPVVNVPIADQNAYVNASFSFTFAANTFSDPNAGTVLAYTAALLNGEALPSWLSFASSTRTFSGIPSPADITALQIQVTASDGAGGLVSDVFVLTISASTTQLYRAINVNGPSLFIDGNNWEAGASAPNLTFSNAIAFSNQSVTLVPSTDANHATMIRSSLWGRSWSAALTSVPADTYQVWIYVWEDNSPEIFSVSLEGATVVSNYNSGAAGSWSRLGPFQATVNDGTINLGFTGGASNLSGIEVWRAGTAAGNRSPVVAIPIPDQRATVGMPFSFTFPSSTFSDPDAGTVLTYAASLSPTGGLPGWITFNSSTRTFSGTPSGSDATTLQIQLTASDGAGGSVSDVFSLTIDPASATTFYRAINVNGPALLIDGNNWEAGASAPNLSFTNAMAFANQSVLLVPSTDANRTAMIRSSFWGWTWSATLGAVPSGTYQVWIYVWEDNSPETFSVSLEGTIVQLNYNSGTAGRWSRLGPFQVTINDGAINLGFSGGASNLSGIEVWRVSQQATGARSAAVETDIAETSEETTKGLSLTAFPNPFSEKVTINFSVSESVVTKLVLYDIRGIEHRVLLDGPITPGLVNTVEVAVGNLADGMYVIELMNGRNIKRIKVAISR